MKGRIHPNSESDLRQAQGPGESEAAVLAPCQPGPETRKLETWNRLNAGHGFSHSGKFGTGSVPSVCNHATACHHETCCQVVR
eukprot:676444-Hanusia_phi.AAC.2